MIQKIFRFWDRYDWALIGLLLILTLLGIAAGMAAFLMMLGDPALVGFCG